MLRQIHGERAHKLFAFVSSSGSSETLLGLAIAPASPQRAQYCTRKVSNFTLLRLVKLQTLPVQLIPKLHCKPRPYLTSASMTMLSYEGFRFTRDVAGSLDISTDILAQFLANRIPGYVHRPLDSLVPRPYPAPFSWPHTWPFRSLTAYVTFARMRSRERSGRRPGKVTYGVKRTERETAWEPRLGHILSRHSCCHGFHIAN